MPLPTSADVHVDSALTNISIAYLQNASNFVADTVFPNVPVQKQSDRYFTFDRGDFNRDEARKRAPSTESAGGGFRIDNTPSYFADVWAFHRDIDDQIIANADQALDLERAATEFVTQKLLIRKEKEFTSTFMVGGVWTNDFDGVASSPSATETIHWSDTTNGDPIGDIRDAISTIEESTGFTPNRLVVGKKVWDALQDHPDIVDRVKYATSTSDNPARVTERTLSALFGLERIAVMRAIENTANEGATNVHAFIGGKDALLVHAASSPALMTPSGGYTFSWVNYLGVGNERGVAVQRFRMDALKSERIEGEIAMDMKLVSADLGYFWDGVVA